LDLLESKPMADELIEVEWIATAGKMVQVLDRLEAKIDRQEKALEKVAKTSEKAAEAAAGSFNALETELKQAEAALKKMDVTSAAFATQKKKVDDLRNSLNQAKQAMTGTGNAVSQALSGGLSKVTQLAAGMLTLQKAVEVIVSELQKTQQIRTQTAETTRDFEQAISAMAPNIGAEKVPQAREMILAQAPQIGATPAGLANLVAQAVSGGADSIQEAMNLSTATLKLTAGNVQAALPILDGMLTLSKTTGTKDFQAALGQLSQFQEAGRGSDLALSIRNIAPALAAANTRGERIQALGGERSLELAAVMSQALQDPMMSISGTGLRQLFGRMDMFIAKRQMTLDDGTVSRLTQPQVDAFNALDTLDERIAAARANPEIGRQFLSTVERTSEAFVGIRKIIIGDKDIRDEEAKAARIVTGLEKGQKAYDALIESIVTNTPLTQAANRQEAVRQVARIRDPAAAFEGQIIEEFNKTLKEVNLSGVDILKTQIAQAGISTAIAQQKPVGPVAVRFLEAFQQKETIGAAPTRDERERLQQAIDAINDLIVLQRQAQQNQQPPAPVRVQVQAPAVRPKEAPLPAETAP
jgi:hypothetical protein